LLTQVMMHFFYLNVFTGNWLSPVYWTLAIEVQYYIVVGILFPLLAARSDRVAVTTIVLLVFPAIWLPSEAFLPHWMYIFGMGVLAFRHTCGITSSFKFLIGAALLGTISFFVTGGLQTGAGLLTAMFISFVKIEKRPPWFAPFAFLGTISYSLYLTHWDVGRSMVAIVRHVPIIGQFEEVRLIVGLVWAVIAAYLFYRLIEMPSLRASRLVRYEAPVVLDQRK
jgi:peptidoglycan/LPS O-acetylase OafA/YrhL